MVNASDYSPGPFAPNSVVTIFGSNLSWYTAAMAPGTAAPTQLAGSMVFVNNLAAPVLYVSGPQINFLIPSTITGDTVTIRVVRQGLTGPGVTVPFVRGAPALFDMGTGFAIATHADGSLLSHDSPGKPGEIVVVYATGLGYTDPNPQSGVVFPFPALIADLASLKVSLDGAVLPPYRIKYAGLTPGWVGLYQLNVELPQDVAPDPAIQVSLSKSSSSLKIAVQ